MNIYIYSDESGVLDKQHNLYYVFGGLIFLSPSERETCSRRFKAAEKMSGYLRKLSQKPK